jgi:hypothetical protein
MQYEHFSDEKSASRQNGKTQHLKSVHIASTSSVTPSANTKTPNKTKTTLALQREHNK